MFIFHALSAPAKSKKFSGWADMIHKYGAADAPIDDYSLTGIGGAQVFVEALKMAGPDLTREKFLKALHQIKNFDTKLLADTISFSTTDHAGVKTGAMMTSLDGKLVSLSVWPATKE